MHLHSLMRLLLRGNFVQSRFSCSALFCASVFFSRPHSALPLKPFARLEVPQGTASHTQQNKKTTASPSPPSSPPSVSSLLLWSPADRRAHSKKSRLDGEEDGVYLFVGTDCGGVWLYKNCLETLRAATSCHDALEGTGRRRRKSRCESACTSSFHLRNKASPSPFRSYLNEENAPGRDSSELRSSLVGTSTSKHGRRRREGSSPAPRDAGLLSGSRHVVTAVPGGLAPLRCEAFVPLFGAASATRRHRLGCAVASRLHSNDAPVREDSLIESERRRREHLRFSFPVTALAVCEEGFRGREERMKRKRSPQAVGTGGVFVGGGGGRRSKTLVRRDLCWAMVQGRGFM